MSEHHPDAQPPVPAAEEERKVVVFAVRIDPTLREQIEGLRGITGHSVNDVGVEALNDWVAKTLTDETVQQKAMAELDAEEKRLQDRRAAIAGILGQTATATDAPEAPADGSNRRGKARPQS
ncbi:hypothetical protein F7R91_01695 [Streptomyces luteolifulvus]|uniref:Uncharacterized protein n=1 Tax=Streptomyces luteolifulvus TaxID=2615112 RepID=A0A6H9V949_9ACTN|nr:hypothetical protein [Streptomyces luteolifulvus]KAB1150718.1 hypothetical protein F7R91_01695 [Streptomyces luteolifulvus]